MENIEIIKKEQRNYYLQSYKDFARLNEVIKLMPNCAIRNTTKSRIVDYFYETPERLLEQLNSSIRIRVVGNEQLLTIICKTETGSREFQMLMNFSDKITDRLEYMLFLEDKLQDIYTHRIDIDIVRMLKSLKVFMYIVSDRTQLEIINNSGFNALVNLDVVTFKTKRHTIGDNVVEVKMNCYPDVGNKTAYSRFVSELEQKVMLIPMQETKYEAGKRVFRYEY